jgi:hypothetical protein
VYYNNNGRISQMLDSTGWLQNHPNLALCLLSDCIDKTSDRPAVLTAHQDCVGFGVDVFAHRHVWLMLFLDGKLADKIDKQIP